RYGEGARPDAARAHRRTGDERSRAEARAHDAGGGWPQGRVERRVGPEGRRSVRDQRGVLGADGRRAARARDRPGEGERAGRRRRARAPDWRERRARADDLDLRAAAHRENARHRVALSRRRQRGGAGHGNPVVSAFRRKNGTMQIKSVGVIGAGTMGNGIAQVVAQAGYDVKLCETVPAALEKAKGTIEKSLGKFVEKGKLSAADRDAALGRLKAFSSIDNLADVDYVVEAIAESVDAKTAVFTRLDAITRPE